MSFATVLSSYCNALGCTNREIAEKCGISPSALSRYRNGERTPDSASDVSARLAKGITALSAELGISQLPNEEVLRRTLEGSLSGSRMLGMSFAARVDALANLMGMPNSEIARRMGVSQSYVSRIRSGQRMPSNYRDFALRFARIAALRCMENGLTSYATELMASSGDVSDWPYLNLENLSDFTEAIEQWLLGNSIFESDTIAVEDLLEKMNAPDYLSKALSAVDDAPVIDRCDGGPEENRCFYKGFDQMTEAESVFFETAAAYGAKNLYLSSDIPLLESPMAYDRMKDYLPGIASVVRNGGKASVLNVVERPLTETAVLVENWLPLYLTGSVVPYYLRGVSSRLFCHENYVCEVCALSAEAVRGHQEDGRYYFSTMSEDVEYYQTKLGYVMEHAAPMLEVYWENDPDQREAYAQLLEKRNASGTCREIAPGRYENLLIQIYSGICAIVTILGDNPVHLVVYHPKIRYVISYLR